MTTNPLQQQSAINASKAQAVNGFSKFHAEISKHVFNAEKYGIAISKKLQAILKVGIAEHQEFSTDLIAFVKEAMILVTVASIAVGQKGVNPKDDTAVLLQLEDLVVIANKFIPLLEKLYAAEEGVTPVSTPVEVVANVEEIENVNAETETQTEGTEQTIVAESTTAPFTTTEPAGVKKWTPGNN